MNEVHGHSGVGVVGWVTLREAMLGGTCILLLVVGLLVGGSDVADLVLDVGAEVGVVVSITHGTLLMLLVVVVYDLNLGLWLVPVVLVVGPLVMRVVVLENVDLAGLYLLV